MNQNSVTLARAGSLYAHQGFGRRTLNEGTRLAVERGAKEIAGRCIANVELDRRIEDGQLDEIRRPELAALRGRFRGKGDRQQLGDGSHRIDPEDSRRLEGLIGGMRARAAGGQGD